MELPPNLGLYLLATLLICLSPGPNVLLLLSLGLRHGAVAVPRGVAGVTAASTVFLVVAALGVAAVLAASERLFTAVRWLGAAYLAYVGVRLVVAGLRAGAATAPEAGAASPFWQGFVTHLSNPKAILFWSALLPQFLDATRPLGPQIVLLGLLGMAIDACTLTGYGLLGAGARRTALSGPFRRWIDVAAGTFFVAAAVLLFLAHRG